ncbi:MAG: hypothetical protein IJN97_02590, partial [Oscillospiraceae bacterium]|nr:hypothetical protein [Oscillospiraceae bacterium]
MKKRVKIFWAVIALVVIAITAFCVWQRENIRAVYMYIAADGENGVIPSGMEVLEIPALTDPEQESNLPLD